MKHEFSNKITEDCVKDFFPNLILEEAFIFEEDLEDLKDSPKAMIEYVSDQVYNIVYDTMADGCGYRTSSIYFEWVLKAINEIKCEEIAKAMLVDYLE